MSPLIGVNCQASSQAMCRIHYKGRLVRLQLSLTAKSVILYHLSKRNFSHMSEPLSITASVITVAELIRHTISHAAAALRSHEEHRSLRKELECLEYTVHAVSLYANCVRELSLLQELLMEVQGLLKQIHKDMVSNIGPYLSQRRAPSRIVVLVYVFRIRRYRDQIVRCREELLSLSQLLIL